MRSNPIVRAVSILPALLLVACSGSEDESGQASQTAPAEVAAFAGQPATQGPAPPATAPPAAARGRPGGPGGPGGRGGRGSRGAVGPDGYLPVEQALAQLERMIPKNGNGQLGALAPENLNADRPEAPWNLTGTWFVDLASKGFGDFMFGPPYPEFIGQAKLDFEEGQRIRAEGGTYRDAIGQCFPAGIPMLQTRVWPLMMVQLPTVIYSVSNFNNGFRQIFLDGRDWSDPDIVIYTYNGESLGHWEGDTLVVDTRYIETWNHFIDNGIPISDEFRVQERMRLLEDGKVLQIEHIMTDPNGWVGEWRSTKRWLRVDNTDIGEVECLPDLNDNIPSVQAGQAGLDQ